MHMQKEQRSAQLVNLDAVQDTAFLATSASSFATFHMKYNHGFHCSFNID